MSKTAKRRRKNGVTDVAADTEETPPLITCLPFELIAEVLLYSTSLADVLSLSRTCKHFHATLVQNAVASFIWKRVRARTTPPIPDPIKLGLSEPQLANFIYGGGKCSECGRSTTNMYTSFSARVRFCGDQACRTEHLKHRQVDSYIIPPHASWLPWIEWTSTYQAPSERSFAINDGLVSLGGGPLYPTYVRNQLLQAKNEYNKAALLPTTLDEYHQRKKKYVDRLVGWMNGCLELCRWKWEFTKLYRVITVSNRATVEAFAIGKIRDKDVVIDTPTIVRLLREKLIDLKKVTFNDLEVLWPEIEEDLTRIEAHRKNVAIELTRLRRRNEVERLYREFDRSGFDCFPSLPQFRKLPTLEVFQNSKLDVETTKWRNDFVDTLVKNDIKEWARNAVQAFSERLGYAEWPPTKTIAHPVHWISSRFICTRCAKSGRKATRNKSLTFREAAHHICSVSEKGNQDQWSPRNFVVDVKGTAVITRFATALGMDVQEKTAADSATISRDIVCLSCSAPITMGFDIMVQHSRRHDDMQFMILADEELVKLSGYPVTPGIAARLMQVDQQTKERRGTACFMCKHCIPNPLAVGEAGASSDGKVPQPKMKLKAFSFDGLQCHLKEKHKVVEVADEDFFVPDEYLEEWGYKE